MKIASTISSALLAASLSPSIAASRNLKGHRGNRGSSDDHKKLCLNIINEAFQQPFGAFFVMVHNEEAPALYKRGEPTSDELARLAEDGDPGPLVDYYKKQDGVHEVFAFSDGAPFFLGDKARISVEVPEDYYVTIASTAVAINTNDCFVSINGQKLMPGQVLDLSGLEAATEENNERCSSIPGPACKDIDNRNQRDGNGEGYVHVRRGFFGIGPDLSDVGYDWRNPMLRVTVTE